MVDKPNALIMDTGSFACKAGYSNDLTPLFSYPLVYGFPDDQIESNYALNYYGSEAVQNSSSLTLRDVFGQNMRPNWQILENFYHSLMFNQFDLESIDLPVVTTQVSTWSHPEKEAYCQLLFETFNVPAHISLSIPEAGIYSSGRINGLVIDCGHSQTNVTPIMEGLSLGYSSEKSDFGGKKITEFLQKEVGCSREAARILKEKPDLYGFEEGHTDIYKNEDVQLPDGTLLLKARPISAKAYDGLFRPDLLGINTPGIQELAYSSLLKNDFEVRRELACNIIMIGGNSCFPLFNERFQKELSQMVSNILKVKIFSQNDRVNAAYAGCGIFASLNDFQNFLISKAEYTECGSAIIHRKYI